MLSMFSLDEMCRIYSNFSVDKRGFFLSRSGVGNQDMIGILNFWIFYLIMISGDF